MIKKFCYESEKIFSIFMQEEQIMSKKISLSVEQKHVFERLKRTLKQDEHDLRDRLLKVKSKYNEIADSEETVLLENIDIRLKNIGTMQERIIFALINIVDGLVIEDK